MFELPQLKRSVNAVLSVFDRKIMIGLVAGASMVMAGYAVSQSSGLPNILGNGQSLNMAQEVSIRANEVRAEEADCIQGNAGIGKAINDAITAHTRIAAASPNTEVLFSSSGSCFAQLTQIFDLSFAIPSLASIISAAQNALLAYAQKKVCTAVSQVSGMVASPINDAIRDVNSTVGGFRDLNGMTTGIITREVNSSLGRMDGSANGANGSYSVSVNPFNASQTTFETGPSTPVPTNNAPVQSPNTNGVLSNINAQIAQDNAQLNQARSLLAAAQQRFASCRAVQVDCSNLAVDVTTQTNTVNELIDRLNFLNQQARNLANGGQAPVYAPAPQAAPAQPTQPVKSEQSWMSTITNIFK